MYIFRNLKIRRTNYIVLKDCKLFKAPDERVVLAAVAQLYKSLIEVILTTA